MSSTRRRGATAALFAAENTEPMRSEADSHVNGITPHFATVIPAAATRETEKGLMFRIRAELSTIPGVAVWRNNCGVDTSSGVRYGIGVGSADLVGFVVVRGVPVFAAWEVKTSTGRVRPEQAKWLAYCRRHGCIAGIVRSPEEARALVEEARR
jgi:hypothetical protein